jgi:YihY family inner membrane protein
VSTATLVPETWELSGDDAWRTLRDTGRRRLLRDAFQRMRSADGFSHARSLAFVTSLVLVQGLIAIVGLATALGDTSVARLIISTIHAAVPGPAGEVLTRVVASAHDAGASRKYLALAFGLVGTLVTGTTALGQLERGLNRLYGVEQDRPSVRKYGLGLLLCVSVGVLVTLAFLSLALGDSVRRSTHSHALDGVWSVARWPLGLLLMATAVTLLFRWCPRRRQPAWSWIAFGSSVSVVLWFLVTLGLGMFFRLSRSFGDTYGPLAGIVALQLWALLSAIGVLYGGAVAAQLEAVRAGLPTPQDATKVAESEPDAMPAMAPSSAA